MTNKTGFILFLLILIIPACGPMPPEDPFHLAESKDALGKGYYWYLRGCHSEALRFFNIGLEEARLADNVSLIIKSLNAMSVAMMGQSDLNSAALVLEQALNLSQAHQELYELDSIWGNLALLAFKANRFDDASQLWQQAVDQATKKGLNPTLYYCNLARLHLKEGSAEKFRQQAALALASSKEPNANEIAKADALNLAAAVSIADGQLAEAETYLNQALELNRKNENQTGLAQDLETLAGLLTNLGRYQQAASNLDRAFYLWAALGNPEAQKRILTQIKDLSKKTGFPKNISPYQNVLANPNLFDPINRLCP
jgi:tetratricopeptide (TPR) repeat protein